MYALPHVFIVGQMAVPACDPMRTLIGSLREASCALRRRGEHIRRIREHDKGRVTLDTHPHPAMARKCLSHNPLVLQIEPWRTPLLSGGAEAGRAVT